MTKYNIMHIPTGQFLYRYIPYLKYPPGEVSMYSTYEVDRSDQAEKYILIKVTTHDELNSWVTPESAESLYFEEGYSEFRRPELIEQLCLVEFSDV